MLIKGIDQSYASLSVNKLNAVLKGVEYNFDCFYILTRSRQVKNLIQSEGI